MRMGQASNASAAPGRQHINRWTMLRQEHGGSIGALAFTAGTLRVLGNIPDVGSRPTPGSFCRRDVRNRTVLSYLTVTKAGELSFRPKAPFFKPFPSIRY